MKDPQFRAQLDAQRAARKDLMGLREKLFAERNRRAGAIRAEMKGADEASVQRKLEGDLELKSIARRIDDANAALEDNRRKSSEIVRQRLAPKTKK